MKNITLSILLTFTSCFLFSQEDYRQDSTIATNLNTNTITNYTTFEYNEDNKLQLVSDFSLVLEYDYLPNNFVEIKQYVLPNTIQHNSRELRELNSKDQVLNTAYYQFIDGTESLLGLDTFAYLGDQKTPFYSKYYSVEYGEKCLTEWNETYYAANEETVDSTIQVYYEICGTIITNQSKRKFTYSKMTKLIKFSIQVKRVPTLS